MTYTITWTRSKKRITIRSFAGMVLWVSDARWDWALGVSVEHLVDWVSTAKSSTWWRYAGAMRWQVAE